MLKINGPKPVRIIWTIFMSLFLIMVLVTEKYYSKPGLLLFYLFINILAPWGVLLFFERKFPSLNHTAIFYLFSFFFISLIFIQPYLWDRFRINYEIYFNISNITNPCITIIVFSFIWFSNKKKNKKEEKKINYIGKNKEDSGLNIKDRVSNISLTGKRTEQNSTTYNFEASKKEIIHSKVNEIENLISENRIGNAIKTLRKIDLDRKYHKEVINLSRQWVELNDEIDRNLISMREKTQRSAKISDSFVSTLEVRTPLS